jgi:1-acyl-sn-glycerol-3-phosphate acyltransferase
MVKMLEAGAKLVHRTVGAPWPPVIVALVVVVAGATVCTARSGWTSAIGAAVIVLLLPTLLAWLAIGLTFSQIYISTSTAEAWRAYRENSLWWFRNSGLFDPAITAAPAAQELVLAGTPAVYVMNHFPVALLDTVAIPLLELPRCQVVAGCEGAPWIGTCYHKLQLIRVRPGGGNTARIVEEGAEAIRAGRSVVVFGEGRHAGLKSSWDQVAGMQLGAFLIAAKENCPVVPVALCDPLCAYGLVNPAALLSIVFRIGRFAQRFPIKILHPLAPHKFGGSAERLRDATVIALNAALTSSDQA